MPDDLVGTIVAAGALATPTGLPGQVMLEPPDDGDIYGRRFMAWVPLPQDRLPLAGGIIYSPGVSNPLEIRADQGFRAGIVFHEINSRVWSAGTYGDGRFHISDDSAGTWRLVIGTDGTSQFNGAISASGNISGNVLYGQGIHSWGDSNASGSMSASANLHAGGSVFVGGLQLSNQGGWLYSHSSFQVQGHQLYAGGDGWFNLPSSVRVWDFNSSNNISANGTVYGQGIHSYGDSNASGSMNASGNIAASGSMFVGGVQFYNDGLSRIYTGEWRGSYLRADVHANIGGNVVTNGVSWGEYFGWGRCHSNFQAPVLQSDNHLYCGTNVDAHDINARNNLHANNEVGANGWRTVLGGWGIRFPWASGNQFSFGWAGNPLGTYDAFNVWVDGNHYGHVAIQPSDRRLKDNIEPTTLDALAVICATPMYAFDMFETRERTGTSRHHDLGFIAQELAEYVPYAAMPPPEKWEETGVWSLNLGPLVAHCWRGIQQLAEENIRLKERVKQLERFLVI